ncbi:MAG: carboxypeptidase-like regulatory domain-containing protein [Niabella sp.]
MATVPSKISFTLLLLIISFILSAQNEWITVSGVVKDSKTRSRIANAAISVRGIAMGTVSNVDGEFIFKIPTSFQNDSFSISHITYETKALPVLAYINKGNTIFLTAHIAQLSEIQVNPADPKQVVKLAFQKIKQNYSKSPNLMTAFYRESVRQRRKYISITEALVKISKASYSNTRDDAVSILKGRKGVNVSKADTLNVLLQGGPKVLLYIDVPKNPALGLALINWDNYRFTYAHPVSIDGRPHYAIDFTPAKTLSDPLYNGSIYIDQQNFSIARVEFSLDISDEQKAAEMLIQKKPNDLIFVPMETKYLANFKYQDNRYYLNYLRFDVKFKSDWKRKLFKNTYTIISEMAITQIEDTIATKIPFAQRFKSNMILHNEVSAFYDADFWGPYNIIEPEESIENAIKRLTRKMN